MTWQTSRRAPARRAHSSAWRRTSSLESPRSMAARIRRIGSSPCARSVCSERAVAALLMPPGRASPVPGLDDELDLAGLALAAHVAPLRGLEQAPDVAP